jgi:hypothetical protein
MAIEDTFHPTYFYVEITNPGSLSAPNNGFIDNLNVEEYARDPMDPVADPRATGNYPATKLLSEAKERSNMRWQNILVQCSLAITPDQQLHIEAVGATESTEASIMQFVLRYDRPEYVATNDELNSNTVLYGVNAVKRWVARAISVDIFSNVLLYNPEMVNNKSGPQIQGPMIENVIAGKVFATILLAEAAITVIESDLTT